MRENLQSMYTDSFSTDAIISFLQGSFPPRPIKQEFTVPDSSSQTWLFWFSYPVHPLGSMGGHWTIGLNSNLSPRCVAFPMSLRECSTVGPPKFLKHTLDIRIFFLWHQIQIQQGLFLFLQRLLRNVKLAQGLSTCFASKEAQIPWSWFYATWFSKYCQDFALAQNQQEETVSDPELCFLHWSNQSWGSAHNRKVIFLWI